MNAPWSPGKKLGAAGRDLFSAYLCDDASADQTRDIALELGWSPEKVNRGGLRNAVQALSVSSSPQILLVDLSEASDPLNDINALAEVCEPGTIVVAIGAANDVRLYRDLLASGIHDYLLKPVQGDQLRESLLQAQAMLHGPKASAATPDKPHFAAAVIGVRGGVGASTVAASLAWMLAEKARRTTALLDLDVHFGTGALLFDLEPGRGLTDALENPSRIDSLFIERAMVRAGERLSILSAEAPINQPLVADGSSLFHLQEEMKGAFESVIIDLPRGLAVQHPHLLAETQTVVAVAEQTLAGTRDTIRLLGWLRSQAPSANVIMVVNRMASGTPPEVSRKDFEASIERKIDVTIPYDARLAIAAAKEGKCLAALAKGSKLAAPFDQLLRRLSSAANEEEATGEGASLLDKLGELIGRKKQQDRA